MRTVELAVLGLVILLQAQSADASTPKRTPEQVKLVVEGPRAELLRERAALILESQGLVPSLPPEQVGEARVDFTPEGTSSVQVTIRQSSDGWFLRMVHRDSAAGHERVSEISQPWLPELIELFQSELETLVGSGAVTKPIAVSADSASTLAPSAAVPVADSATSIGGRQLFLDEPSPPSVPRRSGVGRNRPALKLSASAGALIRDFAYNQAVSDAFGAPLQSHQGLGLIVPALRAEWFPGLHFEEARLGRFGLGLEAARSLGGNTNMFEQDFETVYQRLSAELMVGVLNGRHTLSAFAGWGFQSLQVNGDNERTEGTVDPGVLPDLSYQYLQFGVTGEASLLAGWSIPATLGIRLPTLGDGPGELKEGRWFPAASADGVAVRFGVAKNLSEAFKLELGIEYQRFALDMNVTADAVLEGPQGSSLNQSVAGGAVDQYVGVSIGGALLIPRRASRPRSARGSARIQSARTASRSVASEGLQAGRF